MLTQVKSGQQKGTTTVLDFDPGLKEELRQLLKMALNRHDRQSIMVDTIPGHFEKQL